VKSSYLVSNRSIKELERAVVAIESLNHARYNPRKISKEAMEGLEKSIESFGMVQEVVVNKPTMTIVGGHQRVKALMKRKEKNVAVVFVELDDIKEKALNVALNSEHIAGEFVQDDLQAILNEVLEQREDLFNNLRFDELLEEIKEDVLKEPEREKSAFYVIAETDTEEEQQKLFQRLSSEGFKTKCQAM
jgi:hypothetical protein